ncbi:hypothetical protein [Solibacillus sp. FSL K6-1523]|uniref:hypothetical protein n=1 Tax=Solibacillus sp. FSL K6-1523 TaxID=2921471 RepID=UPI0030F5CBD9
MQQMQHTFDEVIAGFPNFITFEDGALYCDMINFLHNMRLKVHDERLNRYTKEERQDMVNQYKEKLHQLEAMTGPLWGYGSPMEGWAMIFDSIRA